MTGEAHHQGGWVIVATFLAALLFAVAPLPDWLEPMRPDLTLLVLIYWCMALPQRVGVGVGWLAGLAEDALQFTLLGQHALAFAVVAYLTMKLHRRIRVFPLWQQAISVLILVLLGKLLYFWINGVVGRTEAGWGYWFGALFSTLLWPWLFLLLRETRRAFDVR